MSIRKLKRFISEKINSEISKDLSYHGLHHTLAVLESCNQYIKRLKIDSHKAHLLRTAALMHDLGILWNYSDHEAKGIEYIKNELPDWGYSKKDIEVICSLVQATKLPQQPKTLLEEIICDADLDYLGTENFYRIGETLYHEFKSQKIVSNRKEWNDLQIRFLENHSYHTAFARKNREPVKQKFLAELKNNNSN
ncbi:MAG: HD domain-containing protein [Bacteroidia bacterium]|nr:HD domain-containing protein [Bacteroidia bacterium]